MKYSVKVRRDRVDGFGNHFPHSEVQKEKFHNHVHTESELN